MLKRRFVWMIVGLVGLVGVGWVLVSRIFSDSTTVVDVAEAVDNYRQSTTSSISEPTIDTSASVSSESGSTLARAIEGLPRPGVYVYTGTGKEGIDVMSNPSHDYPAESAVTVLPSGCGVKIEWKPLAERYEWFELCRVDGGLAITKYGGFHEFLSARDTRELTCPDKTWLLAPEGAAPTPTTCEGSGITDVRTTKIVGKKTVSVGGVDVDGTEIRTDFVTSGATSGTSSRVFVITDDGLPLSWSDNVIGKTESFIGTVTYTENMTLQLSSLKSKG